MTNVNKPPLRILVTVKTYPIPSSKHDELVCTAGVTTTGDFIRLYPINFRDMPFSQQYKKYQWIEVVASKHGSRDSRKESYRPDSASIRLISDVIKSNPGNWKERARFALAKKARSIEYLLERQEADETSLGVFRPKQVHDLLISQDDPEWKPSFLAALRQHRLWETRTVSREPPRKMPFKFHYKFACDDPRCNGHKMMIADWEVGALYWRLVDRGMSPDGAAQAVRKKFFYDLCGPDKDTHFFVGTVSGFRRSWIVLGVFYPKKDPPSLFDTIRLHRYGYTSTVIS